jgi:hypothetical protein
VNAGSAPTRPVFAISSCAPLLLCHSFTVISRPQAPATLPRARQAWPLPFSQDAAAELEASLPSRLDEDNEVLLARLVSPPPSPASAA